jgi:hypothetical protein
MTEQILQMARFQAQRDEETGRLRVQIRLLVDQLTEKESAIARYEEDLRDRTKEIDDLKLSCARDAELSSGNREAQERLTYLKNVALRYLTHQGSDGSSASEKRALARVICTILKFSPSEIAEVERAGAAAQAAWLW